MSDDVLDLLSSTGKSNPTVRSDLNLSIKSTYFASPRSCLSVYQHGPDAGSSLDQSNLAAFKYELQPKNPQITFIRPEFERNYLNEQPVLANYTNTPIKPLLYGGNGFDFIKSYELNLQPIKDETQKNWSFSKTLTRDHEKNVVDISAYEIENSKNRTENFDKTTELTNNNNNLYDVNSIFSIQENLLNKLQNLKQNLRESQKFNEQLLSTIHTSPTLIQPTIEQDQHDQQHVSEKANTNFDKLECNLRECLKEINNLTTNNKEDNSPIKSHNQTETQTDESSLSKLIEYENVFAKLRQLLIKNNINQLEMDQTDDLDTICVAFENCMLNYEQKIEFKSSQAEDLSQQLDQLVLELDTKQAQLNALKTEGENLRAETSRDLHKLKSKCETSKKRELVYKNQLQEAQNEQAHLKFEREHTVRELAQATSKLDATNRQLNECQLLIANLNAQIFATKNECKETDLTLKKLDENLRRESDLRAQAELKCQDFEKRVAELTEIAGKHEKCELFMNEFALKLNQTDSILAKKSNELHKILKKYEQMETKCEQHNRTVHNLTLENQLLTANLKKTQLELDVAKENLQKTTDRLNDLTSENASINKEKEMLENRLREASSQHKCLKHEFESLEKNYNEVKLENEAIAKKISESNKLNVLLADEKEQSLKELNKVKNELTTSQTNHRTLSKKLIQTIQSKDAQITKLEQSVQLYEKEINLLKQVDNLQKTEEETKFVQIANSIQTKLSEKKSKIDQYKSTISVLEKSIESLKSQNDAIKEKHVKLNVKYENLKTQLMDSVVRECEKCRNKLANYENSNN